MSQYWLCDNWTTPVGTHQVHFDSPDHVCRLLYDLLHQTGDRTLPLMSMRNILAKESASKQLAWAPEHQIVQTLAQQIWTGHLRIAESFSSTSHGEWIPLKQRKEEAKPFLAPEASLSWVEFRVVWESDGEPVRQLPLVVVTPDGNRSTKQTDGGGKVRMDNVADGTCEVQSRFSGVTIDDCVTYLGETVEGSPKGESSAEDRCRNPKAIVLIEEHKVKTGETLASIAENAGMTWKDLAKFNWRTDDPDEVNRYLRRAVGCYKRTKDGKNCIFNDRNNPGIILVPKAWKVQGLNTGACYTFMVRPSKKRPRFLFSV